MEKIIANGNYVTKSVYAASGVMEFVIGVSDMGEDEVTAIVEDGVLRIIVNGEVKYITTQFNIIIHDC